MTERQLRIATRAVAGLWIAAVIVIALQLHARGNNNYDIFRTSWHRLLSGGDLYAPGTDHFDFYKYSPTFALLFGPFAVLPDVAGMLLWTAVNAAALYFALGRVLNAERLLAARALVFLDAVGSMQNAQSNVLSAGLMILAFAEMEKRREWSAALAVVLGTLIKLFPAVAASFAIFRPYRLPRFAAWGLALGLLGILAPLIVVSPEQLRELYRSWGELSKVDALTRGYSVMEFVEMLFRADLPNGPIQLLGAAVLLAPLVRMSFWGQERFRLLFLASVLMFCVLFNHKAESPTFVIATAGVALWFLVAERTRLAWLALGFVIVGTTLSSTDIMPETLQEGFFEPYRVKALPVLFVWILTQVELWRGRRNASAGAWLSRDASPLSAPTAR